MWGWINETDYIGNDAYMGLNMWGITVIVYLAHLI